MKTLQRFVSVMVLIVLGMSLSSTPGPVSAAPSQQSGLFKDTSCNTQQFSTLDGQTSEQWQFQTQPGQTVYVTVTRQGGNLEPIVQLSNNINLTWGSILASDSHSHVPNQARVTYTVSAGSTPSTMYYILVIADSVRNPGVGVSAKSEGQYSLLIECEQNQTQGGGSVVAVSDTLACWQTVGGSLTATHLTDRWRFTGTAGQTIVARIVGTSGNLHPALRLLAPDGTPLKFGDSYGESTAWLTAVLPSNAVYTLEAVRDGRYGDTYGNYG